MEFEPVPKQEFMKVFDRKEPLIKDSSMMVTAMTCLRKYFYQYVISKQPNETEPYFAFGHAYHKFREVLEIRYMDDIKAGHPQELALVAGYNDAAAEARKAWKKEYPTDPPLNTRWDFMTTERLMMSCLEAFKWWGAEKKAGKIEVISVEQPFNVQLADGTFTSGRFDQIVRWNGKLYGRDFKTTSQDPKYYQNKVDPNDQFTRYTFAESKLAAGEKVHGQIIEVLYNAKHTKSKKNGPSLSSVVAARSQYQLDQWEREQMLYGQILNAARENDIWPMQPHNCNWCRYKQVCSKSMESAMVATLKGNYVTRVWDNMREGDE